MADVPPVELLLRQLALRGQLRARAAVALLAAQTLRVQVRVVLGRLQAAVPA